MKRIRTFGACALSVAGLVTAASGQIQVAGNLQVNVDATAAPVGPVTYLTNNAAMGGVFIASNNGNAAVTPRVIALGGSGTRGVLLDGNSVSLRHFTDSAGTTAAFPPAGLVGANPVFTVEAWVYKATINNETGPVAWGQRSNGRNVSCNWGRSFGWGGFSWQGGGYDFGWNVVPSAGMWHHLTWTYDGAGNVKLYRDGVLDRTAIQTASLDVAADQNILIGVQHNGAGTGYEGHAAGVVGRVRIHDGVLTDSQVAANYAFEAPSFVNGAPAQDLVSAPIHRYSFNIPAAADVTGQEIPDTGSSPAANAVIKGNAGTVSSDGTQVTMTMGSSATQGYIDLPNGLLSSLSSSNGGPGQVSLELWVRVNNTRDWVEILYFGGSSIGEVTGPGGGHNGANCIVIPAQVGGNAEQSGVRGNVGDRTISARLLGTRKHIVVTWDEASDTIKLFHEGIQVGQWPSNVKMNAIVDVNNWLGRSGWSGDWNIAASYREFRMYNRVLSEAEIRRNYLVGPDVVDGSTLVWNGNVNGNWDASTQNWLDNASAAAFADGKNVQFDDTASGTTTVNLGATVSPASIMVGNDAKPYTISGTGKISGSTGLIKQGVGTLTFSGSQINDYTGPTALIYGKTIVSKLADGGAASALGAASADPYNLRIAGTLSYQGPATTVNRGYLVDGLSSTIEVQNSLTLSGKVLASLGTGFTKTGPGTLAYTTAGSNYLSGGLFPGYHVERGTVVFDGTAGGQTNQNQNEFWVGGGPDYAAHLIISNATLRSGSWVSVGRGNGTVGNLSTITLENGQIIQSGGGFGMGHNAGRQNLATQRVTLNGASSIYVPNETWVGENAGSTASMFLNGTSWFRTTSLRIAGSGATGAVTIANSAVITNTDYACIGTGSGSGPGLGGIGKMTIKDNGAFLVTGDFNVSDTDYTEGQLDMLNNATAYAGTLFVGKNNGTIGVLNQSGGLFTVGGWAPIARWAGSTGTLNLSGGTMTLTNSTADMNVGELGNGTLNVSGTGTLIITRDLVVGKESGAVGTVNLNGGSITTKRVYMNNLSASSSFYFNGGKLIAGESANPNFLSGLTSVQVLSGGAVIDSGNNAITIAQDLYDGGGGGLTKFGAGSLKLSGGLYYPGPTLVSQGKLEVTTSVYGNGTFSTAAGATLGVQVLSPGAYASASGMTLGAGSALDFDLGSFGNPAAPLWMVSGAVTRGGLVTVNIAPTSTLSVGTATLMQFGSTGGAGSFVLGTLPPGVEATLTTTGTTLELNITKVSLPRWQGDVAGGVWDIGVTANWVDQLTAVPMTFQQGFAAVFDDQATGTTAVNLTNVVTPGGVLVSNSLLSYTISGAGRISGGSGLTKMGTGSLTLSTTNNNYTGVTFIDEGGTLVTAVTNNLGSGTAPLTIGTGTLNLGANSQRFGNVTVTNGTIAATGATITATNYSLHNGSIAAVLAGGTLRTVSTNATDVVTATGLNTYTGRTVLGGGTLAVPNLGNGGAASGVGASSANPTNLVFAGGGLNYTGPAASMDRGYVIDGGGTFSVDSSLKLAGEVAAGPGLFRKGGAGTLTYVRPGTNILGNDSYFISGGTLMFDGGASTPGNYLQTNLVYDDIWVGHDALGSGHMVVSNSSLAVTAWIALNRGNGTAGYNATVTLYDSVVTAGNFSMGYWNNIEGNSSFSTISLLGNSSMTVNNRTFIGENVGGEGTINMLGTSRWVQNNEWFALGNSGKGTMVMSNSTYARFPGDFNLGDVDNGIGTLTMADNATNLVSTLYVGKGVNAVGVVNQYGGFLGRSQGGGDWRLANNSSAVGTYNLFGGIFEPVANFQIGAYGTGTWNQTGGEAFCANYPGVGRFGGSTGTMNVSGGTFTQTGTGQLLIIGEEGNGTLTVSGTGFVNALGALSIGHTATGIGLVNLNGGRIYTRDVRAPGVAGGGSATINLNGGVLGANASSTTFMTGLTAANVGAGGAIIDSAAYNIEIAQPLLNAGGTDGGLVKLGTGTLTLSGASTYNGLTTVSNGALIVNGTIPGAATVRSGALLGGSGTVSSVATIQAGGFISAGSGGIGVLSLGATPVLGGTVYAEVNRNGGSPVADRINVTGSIGYAGTLHIVNLGAPLQVNDTFTLFGASGYSGSFSITSFTPGQTVTWDTTQLAVNGTVRVASVASTERPEINTNVSGNQMDISWPSTGWVLQAQTNTISVGLGSNWTTVPGSTTTNRMIFTIDPANGAVFFRLVSP